MIISHQHRFIFIAIPKTGTHSIRQALRQHLGPDDLEQVGLFENKQFPFPELAALRHGHISAQQIRPVLGAGLFHAYFKFAVVRNPYDRFVSYCAFISRNSGQFKQDPRGFMKFVVSELRPVEHLLYRPQWEFVCDEQGALLTDFVARAEQLQDDYAAICTRIGIPAAILGRANETERRDYREYYDEELIRMVGEVYRDDLRLFGYAFGPR